MGLLSALGKRGLRQLRTGEMFGRTRQQELVEARQTLEAMWRNSSEPQARNDLIPMIQRIEQELAELGGDSAGYGANTLDYGRLLQR
jgi:hypothetical protein